MRLNEIENPNNIWTNRPDDFESSGVKYYIDTIGINKITEIAWTVTSVVKDLISDIKKGDKIPLILLEKISDNEYELHDGQHRFDAFTKLYPKSNNIKAAIFSVKK